MINNNNNNNNNNNSNLIFSLLFKANQESQGN